MSNYGNISDNVADSFQFEVNGLKYDMRYPLTAEIDKIQELTRSAQVADEENRPEDVKKISNELETLIYGFIQPIDHEVTIKETLTNVNVRVMRNFNTMIRQELAIQ